MTPEERDLIIAALAWRRSERAGLGVLVTANRLHDLRGAADALTYACQECDTERHTCPRDGNPIEHGQRDCGEHDEPALTWVTRTWADVRIGDRVRLPGPDSPSAIVQTCVHLHWHADPRSSEYQPEPLEWAGVNIKLDSNPDRTYVMAPGKPVEIEIGEAEVHLLNALGWENRVGVIRGETT